ncbi:MAG TPA: DUF4097 family beta strand repeat-containing protein [Gemmatimonadaceae bacterium]|nr:DUF4097 family beta strand repeat-containing protein [Gemmatimonadaceae bacterium]
MRGILLGSVTLMLVATAVSAQGRPGTMAVGREVRIDIRSAVGPVTVTAWDRNEVTVTTPANAPDEYRFSGDGQRVSIRVAHGAPLHVRVPQDAMLNVRAGSGPITIRGLTRTIEAESGSGPVRIEANAQSITATGFSGGVMIIGGGSEITRAESASGSVVITDATGVVDASSSSGSVRASGRVTDARLFSVSGSVSFDGTVESGGRLSAESSSGSVLLQLPATGSAEYELSTVNGSITNSFGPRADRSSGTGVRLRFVVGGGGARIKGSTVSGSVRLRDR